MIARNDELTWIIVQRSPGDRGKGNIIRFGMSEDKAGRIANQLKISHPSCNFWAMPEANYNNPFSV